MKLSIALLAVLAVLGFAGAAVVVLQPGSASAGPLTFPAPEIACIPDKRIIRGPLVDLTNQTLQDDANMSISLEGQVILVPSGRIVPRNINGTLVFPAILFKQKGAIGILLINNLVVTPGIGETLLPSWDTCRSIAPTMMFEISGPDAARLSQVARTNNGNNSVLVEVSPGDRNEWREYRNGPYSYGFRFFFSLLSGAIAIISLYKLIAYVVAFGFHLSIPQFCLIVSVAANTFRTIYHALDPIYMGKVFTGPVAHLLLTISLPANIITTMLLALYWKEILGSGKVQVVRFVSRLKVPFIAICIIAPAVEIASAVLRAITVGGFGFMALIAGIMYIVIIIAMTIFFGVYGFKVLSKLHESDNNAASSGSGASRRRTARNATIMVLLSSLFNIIWIIGMILLVIQRIFYTPMGFHAVWIIVWLGVLGSQLSQVLAFKTPHSGSTSSGSNTQSHTRNTNSGVNGK